MANDKINIKTIQLEREKGGERREREGGRDREREGREIRACVSIPLYAAVSRHDLEQFLRCLMSRLQDISILDTVDHLLHCPQTSLPYSYGRRHIQIQYRENLGFSANKNRH